MASVVLVAACGGMGALAVNAPVLHGATRDQCSRLVDVLPDRVAGEERRPITGDGSSAAAWGDPPIVLRCGVDRPTALSHTSECAVLNDVGWLVSQDGRAVALDDQVNGPLVFTTVGRSVFVEMTVPADYQPPVDALLGVAAAISSTTRDLHPCR